MGKFLAILTVFIWLPFSQPSYAFAISGTVKGGEVTWSNAIKLGGDQLTLSSWTPIAGIPPTNQWSPGVADNVITSISLSGPSGSGSFDVPISIDGMHFNLGSNNATEEPSFLSSGQTCSGGSFDGSLASALSSGTQCSANYSLKTGARVSPFYFYRPVFTFDETALLTKLEESNIPGTYSGMIPVNIIYYYISSGGAHTYYQMQDSLSVQINFIPSYLNSIDVSNGNINGAGLGVMEPEYDTVNHTVSASTIFNIKATGYFAEGLSMDFTSQNNFVLTGSATSTTIPYSITCDKCADIEIVKDGVRSVDQTTVEEGGNVNEINFQYNVHYDDIYAEDVESDTYSGNFIVIFKAVI